MILKIRLPDKSRMKTRWHEPNQIPLQRKLPKKVEADWTHPKKKKTQQTSPAGDCNPRTHQEWESRMTEDDLKFVCWLVGCLTSQQQASVSQGRICSDNFTCCHTEIEVADQTFYLTQSQYTDTGPTSPSADPITPGAWQGSHWSANF